MKRSLCLPILLCLLSVPVFADTWTGYLVDAKCYASEERNVSPFDPDIDTDRDRGSEVQFCRPSLKTKTFAIVDYDGQSVDLDASGNAKAADLVKQAPSKSPIAVTVTGQKHGKVVAVDSITKKK
jgi:hypothetical protein